jgi:hypothetical protein
MTIQSALIFSPRQSARTATAHVPNAATAIHSNFFHTLIRETLIEIVVLRYKV